MMTRRPHALPRLLVGLALAVCGFARAGGGATQGAAQELTATVAVTDSKHAPVPELRREAFGVSEGNSAPAVTFFAGGDTPARVTILIDASKSVKELGAKRLQPFEGALTRLVELGQVENEYTVVAFAQEVITVVEGSRDRRGVTEAVAGSFAAQHGGHSALYDACYMHISKLAAGDRGKRALVIVSDGDDTYSRARMDDLLRQLKETNVVVYAFIIEPDDGSAPGAYEGGRKALERLAKASGGLSFRGRKAKELNAHAERVAAELRRQYVIGFRPAAPLAPGSCRAYKIAVTQPADAAADAKPLLVRSREEFCAAAPAKR